MASMYEVCTADEIDALEACVRDAACRAAAHLRELPEGGLALLRRLKFEPVGCHPLEPRPLNLIEQINQTWTCLVGLAAARLLLERHPETEGFRLNLGAMPGFDLESRSIGVVQAETFAAVDPRNNRKLEKDLRRLRDKSAARHRYVVFMAPGFAAGRHARLEAGPGVEVWVVDV
jgi:hypothetical protein